jgi:hypothetical protein
MINIDDYRELFLICICWGFAALALAMIIGFVIFGKDFFK